MGKDINCPRMHVRLADVSWSEPAVILRQWSYRNKVVDVVVQEILSFAVMLYRDFSCERRRHRERDLRSVCRECALCEGEYDRCCYAALMHLTRIRSATATGTEHQSKWKGFIHWKTWSRSG